MRVCRKCNKSKPLTDYYRNSTTGVEGYHTMCKDCTYEYKKAKGFLSGKSNYQNSLRWRKSNRDKAWCHNMLNDWLKDGRIVKSPYCYNCGKKTEVEAHHDDYNQPLRVYWLCFKCHGKVSRKAVKQVLETE